MRTRPLRLAALLWAILGVSAAIAQTPSNQAGVRQTTPLTVEWIYGDEGRQVASLPSHLWLMDGSLLLYDARKPQSERAFELMDPSTGIRRRAFEMAAAVASLNALLPASESRQTLEWPQAFDQAGRRAVYLFGGDLFMLELGAARFARLTSTEAEERSPGFSPDGKLIAFVRSNDLYVIDLDTKAEKRVTYDGSETTLNGTNSWLYWEEIFGRRDIGYWWSPDSSALAYLQTDESAVPVSYFVDFQPDTTRVIKQRYAKAGQPNPKVRVGIVEVGKPAPGKRGREDTTWVRIIDRPFELILRVKWLPEGTRVSVQTLTRDQHELGLYFADRKTGASTRILTETDAGWINIHDDLHFLKDGRHFLWASERDDYYHLYRYTMDGRLVNQVTHGSWALASSGSGVFWVRQAVSGIDETNGWLYFTAMERSSIERDLYRIRFDGSGLMRLSSEPGVHRISMSPDARFYLDSFSDIRTMPSLTLHRADGSRQQSIASPRTELLARFDFQYPELLTIAAADGFPMPARVLKPRNFRADRRHPVILAVYGGASSASVLNAWQSDLLFYQLLLDEGYVVVKVDNRSATGISKRLENTVVGKVGEPETSDLLDATRWLKAQPWVDPGRIGVWGWSNGGFMTLNLMTRSTEFKAGISVAPVTDWRYYDSKWAEAFLQTPAENPDGYARTSLVKRAGDLHGRLLLVHGTYDDNVHPQNTQAFIDALIKHGKMFDMMIYPMRKHDIGDRAATVHLYRTMLEFWKRNL
ncbi:MAG TPA: S9 family peptidase [Blastocatellia bacterium]|nr:S9 family peptidase [Blastocatellia bacterium]